MAKLHFCKMTRRTARERQMMAGVARGHDMGEGQVESWNCFWGDRLLLLGSACRKGAKAQFKLKRPAWLTENTLRDMRFVSSFLPLLFNTLLLFWQILTVQSRCSDPHPASLELQGHPHCSNHCTMFIHQFLFFPQVWFSLCYYPRFLLELI